MARARVDVSGCPRAGGMAERSPPVQRAVRRLSTRPTPRAVTLASALASLTVAGCDTDGGSLDAEVRVRWAAAFGSPADDRPESLVPGAAGASALGLAHEGPLRLGGETLPGSATSPSLLVARVSAAGSASVDLALAPGAAELWSNAVARDALGNLYVGGFLTGGALDLPDGSALEPTGGTGFDGYAVKRGPDGALRWAERYGGSASVELEHLVATSGGRVWAVGDYRGSFDLGGTTLPPSDAFDGFAVRLSPTGAALDVITASGPEGTRVSAVAAAPDGGLVLGGVFTQRVTVGALEATADEGGSWAARVDADGVVAWLEAWPWSRGSRPVTAVAVDPDRVLVGGTFTGTLEDPDGDRPAQGSDVWILELTPAGARRQLRVIDGEGTDDLGALALGPSGAWAGGFFERNLSFERRALEADAPSGWIARLNDTLDAELTFALGGGVVTHLAPAPEGDALAAGTFVGALDLGTLVLESAGAADVFLLRVDGR